MITRNIFYGQKMGHLGANLSLSIITNADNIIQLFSSCHIMSISDSLFFHYFLSFLSAGVQSALGCYDTKRTANHPSIQLS